MRTSLLPSSIEPALQREAFQWAKDLKLGNNIISRIPELPLSRIFSVWANFVQGYKHRQIYMQDLPNRMHGITRIRGGEVHSIGINQSDPPARQALSVVHELLHRYFHPNQPNHEKLHTLAAGLAKHIFPRFAEEGKSMPGLLPEELMALSDEEDDFLELLEDEDGSFVHVADYYDDDEDDDDEFDYDELFEDDDDDWDDYDLHSWKKFKRKFKRFKKTTAAKVLMPHLLIPKKIRQKFTPHGMIQSALRKKRHKKKARKRARAAAAAAATLARPGISKGAAMVPTAVSAGPAALATQMAYKGWIVPELVRSYEGQTFLLPRRGVARASRITNIGGWKPQSYAAWWQSMLQSLESGSGRTVKDIKSTIATAAATNLVLDATTRSVGLLCRYSFSGDDHDNRRLRVRHFTGAGQVELEYQLDLVPVKGVSEWIVLNIENDSGSGVPTAQPSLEITIDAGEAQAGAQVSIESINLRDLQA